MVLGPMESISSLAGPSTLPSLSGPVPGVLDSSQPSRLFRQPNSELSFAFFDPLTATAARDTPHVRNQSLDDVQYRPKRIVVETAPNGDCNWRFVPKARMEDGVQDEGTWPRFIELCGDLVKCSQDQWDIYKLDPEYDCCVRASPHLSVISRVIPKPKPDPSPQSFAKRSSPEKDTSPPSPKKKPQTKKVSIADSSDEEEEEEDDEDEVEDMVVDELPRFRRPGERSQKVRAKIEQQRKVRREKIALAEAKRAREEMMHEHSQSLPSTPRPQSKSVPPESITKRKVSSLFGYFRPGDQDPTRVDDDDDKPGHPLLYKRTRTVSPMSAKRELEEKRIERERRKRQRWEQKLDERKREWERNLMDDILKDVPDLGSYPNGMESPIDEEEENTVGDESWEGDRPMDEEAARAAAIAESRRKLAELEADRPLWEEYARKRAAREQAEEAARLAKAEQRRAEAARKAEEERRLKAEREEQETRRQEEALRKEREEIAKRERERRYRQHRWIHGPWTIHRALERYKILSASFDETKFSPNEPLTFDAIPWPVLHSPVAFTIEDIDWGAVEKFFEAVKSHMRIQDYKDFVQASHRRFHPDRWRARGLLRSVMDETERGCLEVASNAVAQALTPLWREARLL